MQHESVEHVLVGRNVANNYCEKDNLGSSDGLVELTENG